MYLTLHYLTLLTYIYVLLCTLYLLRDFSSPRYLQRALMSCPRFEVLTPPLPPFFFFNVLGLGFVRYVTRVGVLKGFVRGLVFFRGL